MSSILDDLSLSPDAFRMEIVGPNGIVMREKSQVIDGKEAPGRVAYIDVFSTRSPAAEKWRKEAADRAGRIKRRKSEGATYDEQNERGVEMLIALTSGWFFVSPSGEPADFPFTKENARALYSRPGTAWIGEQVILAATEDANFTKASSKT